VGTEGWYNDEADPAIARWYDGTGWTSHTMVKAEWAGPGEPPPPGSEAWFVDGPDVDRHDPALYATVPRIDTDDQSFAGASSARTATITAPPVMAHAPFDQELGGYDDDVEMWGARPVGAHFASDDPLFDPDDDYEYGGYPVARPGIDWGRFGAPLAGVAALVVALLAFQLVKDDGGDPKGPVESASSVSAIDGAVERARQGLAVDVTDGDLKALIRGLCDVAEGGPVAPVAGDAAIAVDDPSQLTGLMAAAARGAADYCPASTAASNGAVDDVVAAAGLQITTTTVAPVETTQVDSTAGDASSGSSKKGSSASASSGTARSSSNGGVVRTESRSQSSTNPAGLPGTGGSSQDQVDVGNIGNNRQVVDTVVTSPPPTEAPPDTTDTSAP
jgi:hypothetical protein